MVAQTKVGLLSPAGQSFQAIGKSGTVYVTDSQGLILVPYGSGDIAGFLASGWTFAPVQQPNVLPGVNNYAATSDPGAANDNTQDYAQGSIWVNNTTGVAWICESAGTGTAVWAVIKGNMIGRLLAANMNASTDQAIPMFGVALVPFRIRFITVKNASVSLTTAAGGVYPQAAKAGTAIVAAGQVYTALNAANVALDLTIVAGPGNTVYPAAQALFLSLTTPQGAPATADVYVFGDRFN